MVVKEGMFMFGPGFVEVVHLTFDFLLSVFRLLSVCFCVVVLAVSEGGDTE